MGRACRTPGRAAQRNDQRRQPGVGQLPAARTAPSALKQHGEAWQHEAFLKPLIEGRWTGTMCLTEPLRHRPGPAEDQGRAECRWQLRDRHQDLHHRRRARPDRQHRAPGAGQAARRPSGRQGHLAVVTPKFKVDREGNVGERNALRCGSIEHKMGIKGSVTCVMNFDGAQGYLVGQPHRACRRCSP